MRILENFIDGRWQQSVAEKLLPVINPATLEPLASVPLSKSSDVDAAVQAAKNAFPAWSQTPAIERARYLFKFKSLLEGNLDELSSIVTKEHGKCLAESKGSVRRGMENVEHACGMPTLLMRDSLCDIARGIDTSTFAQAIGVFAAIVPFNFPAMVPFWFWPYAVAAGNTFILKPSEKVPLSQEFVFRLIEQSGFPAGVLNMVHGNYEAAQTLISHPQVDGISFVGSTPVAKKVYEQAALSGKRVQALGGAKNYVVLMPDAHSELALDNILESAFGCAGQRCLAASMLLMVDDAYDKFMPQLLAKARSLKVGNGMDPSVQVGPLISRGQKDRVLSLIEQGINEKAYLALDGRLAKIHDCPSDNFVGPSIFDNVDGSMRIAQEEIFGPVLCVQRVGKLSAALDEIHQSPFANATSIFTQDGKAARHFSHNVGVSMIGVNIGVPAPMAFFPFGGTKQSFFGTTKAHGKEAVNFYTDTKVVSSRWF